MANYTTCDHDDDHTNTSSKGNSSIYVRTISKTSGQSSASNGLGSSIGGDIGIGIGIGAGGKGSSVYSKDRIIKGRASLHHRQMCTGADAATKARVDVDMTRGMNVGGISL